MRRRGRARSSSPTGRCRSPASSTTSSSTTAAAGSSAGTYRLTDAEGEERTYSFTDLGWVYCQGGGYFGGFDDGLGQGVYRGDYHVEGEVWDVSHPTQIVDEAGESFEFDHDWAENFVRAEHAATRPGSPTSNAS